MNILERLAKAEAEIAAVREQLAKAEEPAPGGFLVKPEIGDEYLYVDDCGGVERSTWDDHKAEKPRYASGNCFTNDDAGKREAEWFRDTMWWRGANKGKPLPKVGDVVWTINGRDEVISLTWTNIAYNLTRLEAGVFFIDKADAERQLAQIQERMNVLGL